MFLAKIVCYTNGGGVPISSLNPSLCTHIIHNFMQLDFNGSIQDTGSVTGYLSSIVSLKATNPRLKVMIAFGGASGVASTVWPSMVANAGARQNFASQVLNYLKTNKIDGVGKFEIVDSKCQFVQQSPCRSRLGVSWRREYKR